MDTDTTTDWRGLSANLANAASANQLALDAKADNLLVVVVEA